MVGIPIGDKHVANTSRQRLSFRGKMRTALVILVAIQPLKCY